MTRRPWIADSGAAAILVALLLAPTLITAAALGVDVARWFVVLERVQRAADAAALAAAPLWQSSRSDARIAALDAARRNGVVGTASTRVTVQSGSAPGLVRVAITSRVSNVLGAIVGVPSQPIERFAEAAYVAPVSLGSSCNLFGDEPDPARGTGTDRADGSGTVASRGCLFGRDPHVWATIAGPDTSKVHGDRYASRWCDVGNSGCSGRSNNDYTGGEPAATSSTVSPPSYFFRITVRRPVPFIAVQMFDPAFVDVGAWCERLPRASAGNPAWPGLNAANPFVSDAVQRYAFGNPATTPPSAGTYCTGDDLVTAPGTAGAVAVPVTTSVALHAPTASGDPWRAAVIPGCVRQFPGWSIPTPNMVSALTAPPGRNLQRLFRQWITVCTVMAPEVGDYFLQVRTNIVPGGATVARMGDPRQDAAARGTGQNRFALRVDASGAEDAITIAGVERMAIYSNLGGSGSATFLLARVVSAAAGSVLRIELFDIGDAGGTTTLRIVPPPDAAGTWSQSCEARGEARGSPTSAVPLIGCRLSGIGATAEFNGQVQRIDVPLPGDYRCADTSAHGCWFRVDVDYDVALYDATTWSAWLEGDPVRLVR